MKLIPFTCNFDDDVINELQHELIDSIYIACVVDNTAKRYIQIEQQELVAAGIKRGLFTGKSEPDAEWTIYWKIPIEQIDKIEKLSLGMELPDAWRDDIWKCDYGRVGPPPVWAEWWEKNERVLDELRSAKVGVSEQDSPDTGLDIF